MGESAARLEGARMLQGLELQDQARRLDTEVRRIDVDDGRAANMRLD
jgi:hypothetical protein